MGQAVGAKIARWPGRTSGPSPGNICEALQMVSACYWVAFLVVAVWGDCLFCYSCSFLLRQGLAH